VSGSTDDIDRPKRNKLVRGDLQKLLTELIANIDSIKHAKKIRWSLDAGSADLF
jgi:hypothetical protein